MLKVVTVVMIMLVSGSMAVAQVTVMDRMTSEGHHDLGLITKDGEIWGFGLQTEKPIVEVGKLVPAGKLLIGGYISYWSSSKELYAEPFAVATKDFGKIRFKMKPFAYLPLNGGKVAIGTDEASLTYQVSNHVRAGVVAQYWQTAGQDALTAKGFQIEWKAGMNTTFTVRNTTGDLGQTRLVWCQSF